MPRKKKVTGFTKLGMDKKYLNEDIYIYQNPFVESRGIVELEVIEKYNGPVWIKDRKPKKEKVVKVTKQRLTDEEKYQVVQMKLSKLKDKKHTFLKRNTSNANDPRYFPFKSKYELQLIADVNKIDPQYLVWWYDNSFDKDEERNLYIKAIIDGNSFNFKFKED